MKVVLFHGGTSKERAEADNNREIRPWMVWNARVHEMHAIYLNEMEA